ncbi:cytochrome b5 [Curvularia clavata]|uniref:Cytochrome b5 n=1 Tax=Curvularia clavata TaxID=95742 RepID=A0A9Q8Z3A7_CURCL|nr:cytochrome b5 [Curvularia clavata]
MSDSFTPKQVAEHNTVEKGLYIIIDGDVYKMDSFVDEHPGGAKILKRVGGKDASKQFWKYHNEGVLKKYAPKLKIGSGAKNAFHAGFIKPQEVMLLNKDVRSVNAAVLGNSLGYTGGVMLTDANQFIQAWGQRRAVLQPQLDAWRQAVQADLDERFTEPMLARAAASWRHHRGLIPNRQGAETNMDLYLFD